MLKQCLFFLGVIIIVIAVYCPSRHARRYEFIKTEKISESLNFESSIFFDHSLKSCNYENIILNNEDVNIESVCTHRNFSKPFAGE